MRKMVMIQWENQADSILTNDPTISHNGENGQYEVPRMRHWEGYSIIYGILKPKMHSVNKTMRNIQTKIQGHSRTITTTNLCISKNDNVTEGKKKAESFRLK